MINRVVKCLEIDEQWRQGKILLSISRGTIAEVFKYYDNTGSVPTIVYAYRFYEAQNSMYLATI